MPAKIIGDQLRSEAAPQEVRPGRTSGEVMPTSSGSDAASQEAEKSQSDDAGQSGYVGQKHR